MGRNCAAVRRTLRGSQSVWRPNFLRHPSWGCRGPRPQRLWQGRPRTVGKVAPSVSRRTCVPGPHRARTHPGVELAVRHVPVGRAGGPGASRDAGSGLPLRPGSSLARALSVHQRSPVQSPRTGPRSSSAPPSRVDGPAGADVRSLPPARPLLPGRRQRWCRGQEWRGGGEKARRAPGSAFKPSAPPSPPGPGAGGGAGEEQSPGSGTRRPLLVAGRTPHRCGRGVAPAARS
ncbi:hypothetical protein NN561_020080 [Cricetulus griseus]